MRIYNVNRQEDDVRDYKLRLEPIALALPRKIDLRPECPPVFNQGELGSCTANAGVAARMMLGQIKFVLSRLYLYYRERELEGNVDEDAGATMRTICRALKKHGVPREILWPYIISNFAKKPKFWADLNAKKHKITAYRSFDCPTCGDVIDQTKRYLAVKKLPVLIGITVYESFESLKTTRTGKIELPIPQKEKELGGHALLIVGYDDQKRHFIVRNSWGSKWGDKGYGYMPYEYVTQKFAYDFWIIE
ncbi:MAG: C1 family peptidase [Oscillospiraceae bacterium]